jgi:hypothetical protein
MKAALARALDPASILPVDEGKDEMLVVEKVVELQGGGLRGIVLLSVNEGGELWTFVGRNVVEAVSLVDRVTVPLQLKHVDRLHELGLIDEQAVRRLICVVVR